MNTLSGLKCKTVLSCLVPGLRNFGPERKSQIEEWGVGSGLLSLHVKGACPGEEFTVSENWLAWGVPVFLGSVRPQMSKHQNKKT